MAAQEQAIIICSVLSKSCGPRQGHYTFVDANVQYGLDFVPYAISRFCLRVERVGLTATMSVDTHFHSEKFLFGS